ncbi:inner membrane protein [Enterobacter sp. MGH 24]|nr:inner membrane protein [Enterobacter sp. MGH 24]
MTKITYNASSKPLNNPVTHSMTLNRFCYSLLIFAAIGSLLSSNPVVVWFLLINVLTVVLYGADKMAARKGMRRVPEATLLVFGVTGGWPGAIVGQQLFRHKTQKQPFKTYFFLSIVVSIAVMAAVYHFSPVSSL